MAENQGVADKVDRAMDAAGEQLEKSGQSIAGKAMRKPVVRRRVSQFVGEHPYMAAGLALAGIGACVYFKMNPSPSNSEKN